MEWIISVAVNILLLAVNISFQLGRETNFGWMDGCGMRDAGGMRGVNVFAVWSREKLDRWLNAEIVSQGKGPNLERTLV